MYNIYPGDRITIGIAPKDPPPIPKRIPKWYDGIVSKLEDLQIWWSAQCKRYGKFMVVTTLIIIILTFIALFGCVNKQQLFELQTQEIMLQKDYDNASFTTMSLQHSASEALTTNLYMQKSLIHNDYDKESIQRKINNINKIDSIENEYFIKRAGTRGY